MARCYQMKRFQPIFFKANNENSLKPTQWVTNTLPNNKDKVDNPILGSKPDLRQKG